MRTIATRFRAVGIALLAFLLVGCGERAEKSAGTAEKSAQPRSQTLPKKESIRVARPEAAPVSREEETSDAKEIVGSLMLVEPNEIRLYFGPSFPPNRRASVCGTVYVDGGSTVPSPFYQTPSMEYLVARVPAVVKPPIGVTLKLGADGYKPTEFKMTLSAVISNEKKAQAVAAADNPRDYSNLIELEMTRLQTVVENGDLSLAPDFVRQLADAVNGLALTSGEHVEMKLQHALTYLGDAATSMTQAREKGDLEYAKKLLEEIRKTIATEVAPHFVKD